jgi:hypothetical protein
MTHAAEPICFTRNDLTGNAAFRLDEALAKVKGLL